MSEDKKVSIVDRIWDFLASVKLAIIIFSLIGLTSIVGTIIEQNADPRKNIEIIRKFFGDSLAPTLYKVFDSLGFMDMYHSWWFVLLLVLFASNLLICSIDRFPRILRQVREPMKPASDTKLRNFSISRELTLKGSVAKARENAARAMKKAGFSFQETEVEGGGGYQLYGQKASWSRLGVYVTHFSILLILAGAVIGVAFGFKGFLNLPEGATYTVAFKRGVPIARQDMPERNSLMSALDGAGGNIAFAAQKLGVGEDRLKARLRYFGIEPIGFALKCEDFDVSFYGRSDMAKEYASLLTVFENGRTVKSKWIEVNDPLKHNGYTFYQSSYSMMPDLSSSFALFKVTTAAGQYEEKRVRIGESFKVAGTGIEVKVSEFSPSLSFDQSGRAFTYSEMMNNPAVRVDITEGDSVYSKWIARRRGDTWNIPGGHVIQFTDMWGAQFTGLQVRKDPGVWIVYLGCFTMSVGLFIAFFMSHRRLWISVRERKNAVEVLIGATANKNAHAFERKIDKIAALLKEGGK